MVVFLVSGLWHGANWTFVIWGGLNALYQIVTLATAGIRAKMARLLRVPDTVSAVIGILVTFHLILVSWVFFRAATLADAITVLSKVAAALPRLPALFAARTYTDEIILSVVFIVMLVIIEAIDEGKSLWERLRARPAYMRWSFYYAVLICLTVFGKWNLTEFVYMQF